MTNKEIIGEFEKEFSTKGIEDFEQLIKFKEFILKTITQDRKDIIEMIEGKIIEPNEFGHLSERNTGKNLAYRKILNQLKNL